MSQKYVLLKFITILIIVISFSAQAGAADIDWKIFIGTRISDGPHLTETTSEGEALLLKESDFMSYPSDSADIVSALDGVSFLMQTAPAGKTVSIHVIMNVAGNAFQNVGGKSVFINFNFVTFIDGVKEDDVELSRNPLVLNIPTASLNSLLSLSDNSRDNLLCVYSDGGNFSDDGIDTSNTTSGLVARLYRLSHTVGSTADELGIEPQVKIDTWGKIKLLFQ